MKKYEALFILSNTVSDEQLESKIGQINSEITKLGGNIQSSTRMGRITFTRKLAKKEAGIYVQILFLMEHDKIGSLYKCFRRNEDIIRLQIVKAPPATEAPATTADKKEKKHKLTE